MEAPLQRSCTKRRRRQRPGPKICAHEGALDDPSSVNQHRVQDSGRSDRETNEELTVSIESLAMFKMMSIVEFDGNCCVVLASHPSDKSPKTTGTSASL